MEWDGSLQPWASIGILWFQLVWFLRVLHRFACFVCLFFGVSEYLLGLIWVDSAKVCCRLSKVGSAPLVMASPRLVCTLARRLMRHGECGWHARACARLAVSGGGLGRGKDRRP